MKVIAYYLPQFHRIPENDEWWGEGFTEWTNVKSGKPLFNEHYQPRIPQNENYYNLLDPEVMRWQTQKAHENGLYGFCFYHYWFSGHMLLENPVNNYLNDKKLPLHYCLCWANEHWTNAWVSNNHKVLIEQDYGNKKEWEEHFAYFLPFFMDERYIRIDNKPFLMIYRPEIIPCLNEMLDCWSELAVKNGLKGLTYSYQQYQYELVEDLAESRFSLNVEYQPIYAFRDRLSPLTKKILAVKKQVEAKLDKYHLYISRIKTSDMPDVIEYDKLWDAILTRNPKDSRSVPGAFVDWDNTPRHQTRGSVALGSSPEKFKKYLIKQIGRARNIYNKDYIFLFAWNEWSEAGYLEPDEKYGDNYLRALNEALIETNEYPY